MFRWFARRASGRAPARRLSLPKSVPAALPNEDSYLAARADGHDPNRTARRQRCRRTERAAHRAPPSLRPAGPDRPGLRRSPLPIGYGQTISQPYIVALMSEALQVHPGDKVLEIGTGSAYRAAVWLNSARKPTPSGSFRNWRIRPRIVCRSWATQRYRCATPTATSAGKSTPLRRHHRHRRARPPACPSRSPTNWPKAKPGRAHRPGRQRPDALAIREARRRNRGDQSRRRSVSSPSARHAAAMPRIRAQRGQRQHAAITGCPQQEHRREAVRSRK